MFAAARLVMGESHRVVVFDAVVRTGSFTGAARSLGVTQPAVSRQIALLEDILQTELFRRDGNTVSLTVAGRVLHERVQRALEELDAGVTEIRGSSDELTLAVQPAIADSWFSPRLDSLREALAPSALRLVIYDLESELDDLDHDVSIRFGDGRPPRPLRSTPLVHESVVPVAAPELADRFGLSARSSARKLSQGPQLLRVDPSDRTWLTWAEWFEAAGVKWQAPAEEIVHRNYAMLVQQALSGRGVVLGWETLLGDLVNRRMLVPVGTRVDREEMGYHLFWPPGLKRHTGLERLVDWITAVITDLTDL